MFPTVFSKDKFKKDVENLKKVKYLQALTIVFMKPLTYLHT